MAMTPEEFLNPFTLPLRNPVIFKNEIFKYDFLNEMPPKAIPTAEALISDLAAVLSHL